MRVRLSLKIFNITVLIKLVIKPTSIVKCPIIFPECFLFITSMSEFIKDLIKSNCRSLVTSCAIRINITLAKYKEKPFTENAKKMARGIINNKVLSFSINIFSIAGSSNQAIAEVDPATQIEKKTDKNIFGKNLFV